MSEDDLLRALTVLCRRATPTTRIELLSTRSRGLKKAAWAAFFVAMRRLAGRRCARLIFTETEQGLGSPRPIMRQYELVDRVRKYNPHTNEALLDRAYVYAMKAHGSQTRASGDPYFSHPLEVAAILTDMRLDDAPSLRRSCMTRSRIPRRRARRSIRSSARISARWSMA